jgi:UDP-4-amino-4-deoxy-L-arabinose formyltransferase/UDP-glucuronic acid dehydrogenase (UDP-4-keto-hexauronic acid decarboxylating)
MVINGEKGIKQTGKTSYYRRGCPHGGIIDPAWPEAYQGRFIRAMIHPPYAPATLRGKKIFGPRDLDGDLAQDPAPDPGPLPEI